MARFKLSALVSSLLDVSREWGFWHGWEYSTSTLLGCRTL